MVTGAFSIMGSKDISPVERKSAQDMADIMARCARLEMALSVARKALIDIRAHHAWMNSRRGRPLSSSHTVKLAQAGLEDSARLRPPEG